MHWEKEKEILEFLPKEILDVLNHKQKDILLTWADKVQNRYFHLGVLEGIRKFAIWKDGKEYVGCGYHTLEEALEEYVKENKLW